MCCFKPSPRSVSATEIFASHRRPGRQTIVYSMSLTMTSELAMILPVPVKQGAADDAVKFINMENYPTFFEDLARLFPSGKQKPFKGGGGGGAGGGEAPPLEVHSVGQFSASFVPTIQDFDRLDEQFRIDKSIWLTQRQFAEYGFVVFQLKPPKGQTATENSEFKVRPHPMAFEFPVRNARQPLFFPTVHIHDGTMDKSALFDHVLYGQTPQPDSRRVMEWEESQVLISSIVKKRPANQLILESKHCFRKTIRGEHRNEDTWL
jgi:hypothetical protein